ncbi:MAG TPA: hypothetical protein VI386_12745 [Candidatus Sulfotelmatobacter sp.]
MSPGTVTMQFTASDVTIYAKSCGDPPLGCDDLLGIGGLGSGPVCDFTVGPANVLANDCSGKSQNSNNFSTTITPASCLANSVKSKCGASGGGNIDLAGQPSCVYNLGNLSGTVKYFAGPKLPNDNAGTIDMTFDLYFDVLGTDIARDVNATVECP